MRDSFAEVEQQNSVDKHIASDLVLYRLELSNEFF